MKKREQEKKEREQRRKTRRVRMFKREKVEIFLEQLMGELTSQFASC